MLSTMEESTWCPWHRGKPTRELLFRHGKREDIVSSGLCHNVFDDYGLPKKTCEGGYPPHATLVRRDHYYSRLESMIICLHDGVIRNKRMHLRLYYANSRVRKIHDDQKLAFYCQLIGKLRITHRLNSHQKRMSCYKVKCTLTCIITYELGKHHSKP